MVQPLNPHSQNMTYNLSDPAGAFELCDDMMAGIVVWALFSGLSAVVGCPACIAVLWELARRHKKQTPFTPNDVFMLNLTVMDFFFLSVIPLVLANVFHWHINVLKMVSNFFYSLNLVGRPLLTECICLDCYLAVVHPVTYRSKKSLTPRVLVAVGVWTITVAIGILYVVIIELNHSPWAMVIYVLILPVIVVCDVLILWTLKKSNCKRGRVHPRKKKAVQIVTNSMIMTVTSYLPPVVGYIVGDLVIKTEREYECLFAIPILIPPTAGSAIMPMLYLGYLGRLKSLWTVMQHCRKSGV